MIHLYPANRLEDLSLLLDKVLEQPADQVLTGDIVLVQNRGMQHWLNMQMAAHRGIAMNIQYQLPAHFFWGLIRTVLGPENVPEISPYSRNVLSWRLFQLLGTDEIINNPTCHEATRYWQQGAPAQQPLRRFQLACELADLYEQYLIYRPDWIQQWDRGETPHWQAQIWQHLRAEHATHPLHLLQETREQLTSCQELPARLCVFGINALAPLWLDFLGTISEHLPVHLFHLNPCVEYWGDLPSDRQLAKWLDSDPQTLFNDGNPLLANLGNQGKEFLSLIQERETVELPVFTEPATTTQPSLLTQLQQDILTLHDARSIPCQLSDNSLVISSAHSALREVQGLHDWLLHRFNDDPTLCPKDVLVMCPEVEQYAPYVEAVFARGWDELSSTTPPLPCSIADRNLLDADPLVSAFLQLLQLPDSRFAVTEVIDYLRLPAVQRHFSISDEQLDQFSRLLHRAAIHWGLNKQHKARMLHQDEASEQFTWCQGLQRLLLGYAHSDQEQAYQQQWLLPDVEGDAALALGQLFQLLEKLQYFAQSLDQPRTPEEWAIVLRSLIGEIFGDLSKEAQSAQWLEDAIEQMLEQTNAAHFAQPIPLVVIREQLNQSLGSADTSHQFLTGQITFCSMIPMRSIPFRIIAILGLNSGEYPRQRTPQGFDLMNQSPPRHGDRSRRADDRYLFLEALISARETLYLSYQGHDIRNNNHREPSLVLRELMDYLEAGYGWNDGNDSYHTLPMQPFSIRNYQGPQPSFDRAWLKLTQPRSSSMTQVPLSPDPLLTGNAQQPVELTLNELIRFYANPLQVFAQQRLGLYLGNDNSVPLDDAEPFTADTLERYLVQQQLVEQQLAEQPVTPVLEQARMMGRLPDSMETNNILEQWQLKATEFADLLRDADVVHFIQQPLELPLAGQYYQVILQAEAPLRQQQQLFWRLANAKDKDLLRLWLHHLMQCCVQPVTTTGLYRGTNKAFCRYQLAPVTNAHELLQQWLEYWAAGLNTPLLLHGTLGLALPQDTSRLVTDLDKIWHGDRYRTGLADDPYTQYFYPDPPTWHEDDHQLGMLQTLYRPLLAQLEQEEFDL